MKLLLDEHFSSEIARQLQRRGHDVVAAHGQPELRGLPDADLLTLATSERRVLVTENIADFSELHRAAIISNRTHFGLILTSSRRFARTWRAISRIVRALDELLRNYPNDEALVNQTWWLEPAE